MNNRLTYFIANGLFFLALWFGLVYDIKGALNIGIFMVWFAFVVSLFTGSKKIKEALIKNKNYPSVPMWLDVLFDMTIVILLIWFARWYSGTAYIIHAMVNYAVHKDVEKRREVERNRLEQRI